MHPGLGKAANGVQLHVVKYRATVLTFVVGLPTSMEFKRGDVRRMVGKNSTTLSSKIGRSLIE